MSSSRRRVRAWVCGMAFCGVVCGLSAARADVIELGELDLTKMSAGWGAPVRDASIEKKPLSIAGEAFERGVGSHAGSEMHIALDGRAERFTVKVGVDDETQGRGTVRFKVYGDGHKLFDSGVMKGRQKAAMVDVPLGGVRRLILLATSAGDGISYDHADWADARIVYKGQRPVATDPPREEPILLTPPPDPAPRIHGPSVYGARPCRAATRWCSRPAATGAATGRPLRWWSGRRWP